MEKDVMGNYVSELSPELLEAAFRKRLRQYHIEDARKQVLDYFEYNDTVVKQFTDDEYDFLAAAYEDAKDCNVADNAVWHYVIERYLNKIQ